MGFGTGHLPSHPCHPRNPRSLPSDPGLRKDPACLIPDRLLEDCQPSLQPATLPALPGDPSTSRDAWTDEQLVEAINVGDDAAFEALYHRYRDWVVNLAYRTIGDRDLSQDVLQDTFSYLLRKTPDLRLTARMTTFLFPVVRHLAIGARKKAARVTPTGAGEDAAGLVNQDTATNDTPDAEEPPRQALARVMTALSDTHREVVLLRFVDDLSLAEIAEAMEVPVGTIKSRLHHALKALRDDPAVKKYFEQ